MQRCVRSWRLLVGRLFALASVGGLEFSVAGLRNSDCVALGAEKKTGYDLQDFSIIFVLRLCPSSLHHTHRGEFRELAVLAKRSDSS